MTTRVSDNSTPITFRLDHHCVWVIKPWPTVTAFAQAFLAAPAPGIWFRWPFVVVNVINGHAIYRVETCDQGTWRAVLMESLFSNTALEPLP